MKRDYYEILGVPKNANENDVKKIKEGLNSSHLARHSSWSIASLPQRDQVV
jgi:hypothetical protein